MKIMKRQELWPDLTPGLLTSPPSPSAATPASTSVLGDPEGLPPAQHGTGLGPREEECKGRDFT